MLTYETATRWGLHDAGCLRMGSPADPVVFDPETIGGTCLRWSTTSGGRERLKQTGAVSPTIVNGQVLLRNNEHSGAQPGRVLRGPLAQTAH